MILKYDSKFVSVYRINDKNWSWCNKTKYGTCLKHGRPWTEHCYMHHFWNKYQIIPYIHKDKQTITHWLVEHKILNGSGIHYTVEHTPLYPVELVKQAVDNPDYWIVKRKDWPSE